MSKKMRWMDKYISMWVFNPTSKYRRRAIASCYSYATSALTTRRESEKGDSNSCNEIL